MEGLQQSLAYWMESASFYGSDDRLRVYQQYEQSGSNSWRGTGTYEEHRYDALGRRVLSRAREDDPALCAQDCVSTITRYVWDGDQLLHELRAPGAHSLSQSALQTESGTGRQYGRVTYTHGGGIDQPLGVYREGYANEYGSANMSSSRTPAGAAGSTWARIPRAVHPGWTCAGRAGTTACSTTAAGPAGGATGSVDC